ncbi:MAG: hypothetical protein LBD73_08145 [Deferribacteraceae bacterium]|jgi:hypothetical protein|nr:hypothetical protein [Deferribacteraceae bacterium]
MQFLEDNPILADLEVCDRRTLCWTKRELFKYFDVPLFYYSREDTKFYLITDFNSDSEMALSCPSATIEEALDLSLYAYGGPESISEWLAVYCICVCLKLDFKAVYERHNGEFGTAEDIIRFASGKLPDEFVDYIYEKRINRSTLTQALKLLDQNKKVVLSAIKKNMTFQAFKRFVESALDFSGTPAERKAKEHLALEESLKKIANAAAPLFVRNLDNFETDTLRVSFSADNFEDFSAAADRLSAILPLIEDFYGGIKEKL